MATGTGVNGALPADLQQAFSRVNLAVQAMLMISSSYSGVAPAARSAIEALETVEISGTAGGEACSVCLDEFGASADEVVKEMPCKHRYHKFCIEKWLGLHGTCPICRYELPKEEEDLPLGAEQGGGAEAEGG